MQCSIFGIGTQSMQCTTERELLMLMVLIVEYSTVAESILNKYMNVCLSHWHWRFMADAGRQYNRKQQQKCQENKESVVEFFFFFYVAIAWKFLLVTRKARKHSKRLERQVNGSLFDGTGRCLNFINILNVNLCYLVGGFARTRYMRCWSIRKFSV